MFMLQPDPEDRFSMDEALRHPWLNETPAVSQSLQVRTQMSFTAIRGDPAQSSDFGSSFDASATSREPTTPTSATRTLDEQCSQDLENLRIQSRSGTESEPRTRVSSGRGLSAVDSLNFGSIVSEFPSVPSLDDIGMPYPKDTKVANWSSSIISNESPIQITELGSAWQPTPPANRNDQGVVGQDTIMPNGRNKRKADPDAANEAIVSSPPPKLSPGSSGSSLSSLSDLDEELADGIDIDSPSVAGSSKPTSASTSGATSFVGSRLRSKSRTVSSSSARESKVVVKKGVKRQRMSIQSPPPALRATRSSTRSTAATLAPPSLSDEEDEPRTPKPRRNNFKANVKGKLAAARR